MTEVNAPIDGRDIELVQQTFARVAMLGSNTIGRLLFMNIFKRRSSKGRQCNILFGGVSTGARFGGSGSQLWANQGQNETPFGIANMAAMESWNVIKLYRTSYQTLSLTVVLCFYYLSKNAQQQPAPIHSMISRSWKLLICQCQCVTSRSTVV